MENKKLFLIKYFVSPPLFLNKLPSSEAHSGFNFEESRVERMEIFLRTLYLMQFHLMQIK